MTPEEMAKRAIFGDSKTVIDKYDFVEENAFDLIAAVVSAIRAAENDAHKSGYEQGYENGESSGYADWEMQLTELPWCDDVKGPQDFISQLNAHLLAWKNIIENDALERAAKEVMNAACDSFISAEKLIRALKHKET